MNRTQLERSRRWRNTPRGKFLEAKRKARVRGVPWQLTFDEWYGIWQASGRYEQRGYRFGCYVMARRNDEGAYRVGNVSIETFSQNTIDRNKSVARRRAALPADAPVPF